MNKIVDIAISFVGEEEIRGNKGFEDQKFQQLLELCGWKILQAWCVYFVELVWKLASAGNDAKLSELDRLFSGSALQTLHNFKAAGYVVDKTPEIGSIAIWQQYKNNQPTIQGHAGIVTKILGRNELETIEGNTNNNGEREGFEVCLKRRKISFDVSTGLVLKGFIHYKA